MRMRMLMPLPLSRRRWSTLALHGLLIASLGMPSALSATPTIDWRPVDARWTAARWLLLGEVHDNVAQHASRHDWLSSKLKQGWRPVLLMEQLNREHQVQIDQARSALQLEVRPSADQALALASTWLNALPPEAQQGWHWPHYLPVLALALQHDLPVLAANVSRADARLIMREGLQAHGFDADVPSDIVQALTHDIMEGHCGALPQDVARRMVLAQVARDQFMARLLVQEGAQGAVLLAGNGHVRRDVGVPRWLPPALQSRALSVGLLEQGDPSASRYDVALSTPVQLRDVPCARVSAAGSRSHPISAPRIRPRPPVPSLSIRAGSRCVPRL
ncbi:MAG: ChaN family lipoprotein [Aquabacterium sp.]